MFFLGSSDATIIIFQPNRFFQSAPRAIAYYGVSEPLGGGKPEAGHATLRQHPIRPALHLQHEAF
jgi:hypothetical protein